VRFCHFFSIFYGLVVYCGKDSVTIPIEKEVQIFQAERDLT
jgi:hypothetical protein